MTQRDMQRHLERIHILRTIINMGSRAQAAGICRRANEECDLDILDDLPLIKPRGITMKLHAMEGEGLVRWDRSVPREPLYWVITQKGYELANSLADRSPDA